MHTSADIPSRKASHADVVRQFEQLVERIPGIVAYMDLVQPDDPGCSIPIYISPQVEDLLGYPRDQWLTDDELWLDDGIGMTEETIGRVLDPYFSTKFTGRGLGLAAADGVVRGHGGRIEILSQFGTGTTMTVTLPGVTSRG